jgi:type II secretory ATPase GspE/PulE/Tfp pilus assembly ATPase PilB-like protein
MGIEPFLIASTVNVAIGQRLIRTICQKCKAKRKISEVEFKSLTEYIPKAVLGSSREFFQGTGCDKCGNSGYTGRTGIYEILEVNDIIREAIMKRINASEIKKLAQKNGMTTMIEDGFRKAKLGVTTIEEILRVVRE